MQTTGTPADIQVVLAHWVKVLFLDHPHGRGETYLEHFKQAIIIACIMFMGAISATVHAIVPALFPTGASSAARKVLENVTTRTGETSKPGDTTAPSTL